MSSNLRAALTLVLKDELSSGLDRIKTEIQALKNLGRGLTLGHLGQAANVLREVASSARHLTSSLRGVVGTADRAWAAIKRMGGAMGHALNMQSRVGAFATVAQGYSVAAPIEKYATLEDAVRRIGIMKGLSGGKLDAEIVRLTKFFNEEGLASGQTALTGAETYLALKKVGTPDADIPTLLGQHHRAATAFYADPEQFTPVTAALHNQFKIPLKEMEQALSAVGLAANLGRMTVANFGAYFPRIAGLMTSYGMKGRNNANMLLAMLQTQAQVDTNPETASVNVEDMISYISSKAGVHNFDGQMRGHGPGSQRLREIVAEATGGKGLNLPAIMEGFQKQGQNPIEGMLALLQKMKTNLHGDDVKFNFLMQQIFGSKQAAEGWRVQLNNLAHRLELQKRLNAVNPDEAERMFQARYGDPAVQIKLTEERLAQLERRMGGSFLPILKDTNFALEGFQHWLEKTDKFAPGVVDKLGLAGGVLLSFGAAVGALGIVGPIFARGWAMISPIFMGAAKAIGWLSRSLIWLAGAAVEAAGGITAVGVAAGAIVAAVAAAGIDIYVNWDRFGPMFHQMADGLREAAKGVVDFAVGFATLDDEKMFGGLEGFVNGALKQLIGELKIALGLFQDLAHGIDTLSGGRLGKWAEGNLYIGGPAAPPKMAPAANPNYESVRSPDRWGMGAYQPPPPAPAAQSQVHLYVHTDPGTQVSGVTAPGGIVVHNESAGRVLGRP